MSDNGLALQICTNRGEDVNGGTRGPLSGRLAHAELVARGPHGAVQVQLGLHALTHVQSSVNKDRPSPLNKWQTKSWVRWWVEHLDSSTVVTLPTGACAEGTTKVTLAVKGLTAAVGTGVGAELGDGVIQSWPICVPAYLLRFW